MSSVPSGDVTLVWLDRSGPAGGYEVRGLSGGQLAGRLCLFCGEPEPDNVEHAAVVGYIPHRGVAVDTAAVPVWVHTWEADRWRHGEHPARRRP